MSKLGFIGLTFRPAAPKHKRVRKEKDLTIKVYCVCVEKEPNVFIAHVNIDKNNKHILTNTFIPFSPKSYDLKGKTKVFTLQEKDNHGNPICILRDEFTSINFPGLNTQYTPFRNNYVYSGYIINIEGIQYFDVKEIFDHVNVCNYLVPNVNLE